MQVPGNFAGADGQLDQAAVNKVSKAVEAATQQAAEEAGCTATITSSSCFSGSMHYVNHTNMQDLNTARKSKDFKNILKTTVQSAIQDALLKGAADKHTASPSVKVDNIWQHRWELVPDSKSVCLECHPAGSIVVETDTKGRRASRKGQTAIQFGVQWPSQSAENARPKTVTTAVTCAPVPGETAMAEQEVHIVTPDGNALEIKGVGEGPAVVWVHWWHGILGSNKQRRGLDSLLVPALNKGCADEARKYYQELCSDLEGNQMEAYKSYTENFTSGWAALVQASRQPHVSATGSSGSAASHAKSAEALAVVIAHFLQLLSDRDMSKCQVVARNLLERCAEELRQGVESELQPLTSPNGTELFSDGSFNLHGDSSTDDDGDGGDYKTLWPARLLLLPSVWLGARAGAAQRKALQLKAGRSLPPPTANPYITRTQVAMAASWGRHVIEQVAYRKEGRECYSKKDEMLVRLCIGAAWWYSGPLPASRWCYVASYICCAAECKKKYYHHWRLLKGEVQFSGMPLPVPLPISYQSLPMLSVTCSYAATCK